MSFTPKDPSLSYLDDFFFNIYQLRLNLIKLLLSTRAENMSIFLASIGQLKRSGHYDKAIKLVKKQIKKANESEVTHLNWILFSLLYRVNKNYSITFLRDLVISNPEIISYRDYFLGLFDDKEVVEVIQSNVPVAVFQRLIQGESIQQELKQNFLIANTKLLKLVA